VLKKMLFFGFLLGSVAAYAQVAPASMGGNSSVWVGGEFSNFDPDFSPHPRLNGVGIFGDFNITSKLGVEGEARWLHWSGSGGQTQSDYLGGVKYRFLKFHNLSISGKFLLGGVWIDYPVAVDASGSYFAYAPGVIGDYRLTRRLSVRGDYEYQILPSAPGLGGPSHGLTPNGFSVGVAYRLLGNR
jgi:hypothetical protein